MSIGKAEVEVEYKATGREKILQQIDELRDHFNELVRIIQGSFRLMRRLGLGEQADEIISTIMRIITLLNMLRTSILLLEAASGPIGWALAAVSLAGTAVGFLDMADMQARRQMRR